MSEDETPYSIRFVGANPESLDAQQLIQILPPSREYLLRQAL
jgi:hypothetical protein